MELIKPGIGFKPAITAVENYLLTIDEQLDLPVKNYFVNGMYARELFIPAGTVLTGAIHKHEHLCVCVGDLEIASEYGKGRLTGYNVLISKPGAKRIGYAHTDTIFTTFHTTNLTTEEEVMPTLVSNTYEEYNQYLIENAKEDYNQFLLEFGFDEEVIQPLIQNTSDQIPMPSVFTNIELKDSPVHGQGMFATCDIEDGEFIAPARLGGLRTPAGRYTNHSPTPNAMVIELDNGDLTYVAIQNIYKGEEVLIDYRQAVQVNGITQEILECQQQ